MAAWLLLVAVAPTGCARHAPPAGSSRPAPLDRGSDAFLDSLSARTFAWFWDLAHPTTRLTPDRWPTRSFASVGASGFALTAYPIGESRGWVTREQSRARVLETLEFFWTAPQGDAPSGMTGHRGFFYHFLDPATGKRFEQVELSTVDTALLLAGALFCQSWYDQAHPDEARIRALADSIYFRVDWRWAQVRPPTVTLGWSPEGGHLEWDWRGYNEAMVLVLLAMASPTHPVDDGAWQAWTENYRWGTFHGQEHLGFAPLFGHQYSHVWIDFRGIQDDWMRAKGIDYFENSRRATLAQRAYAIDNPRGVRDYGPDLWGLTACDGPVDRTLVIDGRERRFQTYTARGASHTNVDDDGTLSPPAAGGSLAFAPEIAVPALRAMRERYGERLYGRYGFLDAFNPTLRETIAVQHGVVDPALGWFDTDYLGIDQGPILIMAENLRSGLVWQTMRKNPHLVRGLRRAGFTGGWRDAAPAR